LPVAMLVQSIGESCGSSMVRLPLTPVSTIRAIPGMAPESMRSWMIFQSAESQPTSISLRFSSIAATRLADHAKRCQPPNLGLTTTTGELTN